MEAKQFHTADDIQDSIETLQQLHGNNRPVVFWLFLFCVGAAVICLPIIKVDESVGAPGQIRPTVERLAIYTATDGFISELFVVDDQTVKKNEKLVSLDSTALTARIEQNDRQLTANRAAIADLGVLLHKMGSFSLAIHEPQTKQIVDGDSGLDIRPGELKTPQYIGQHVLFMSDLRRLTVQKNKTAVELSRSQNLHIKGLISDSDYDQLAFSQETSDRELEVAIQETLSRWQAEKTDQELKGIDLDSESKQLRQQARLLTLRAPVDGTALGFSGLQVGLYLPSGTRIGEISPSGGLQADVYISPRDIGFVRIRQKVNIQVAAYSYSEWGTVSGTVRDISQDYVQFGQQVAFKVVIDLEATHLTSAAGITAELRRGMTVNARFIVRKRTLFHMLYSHLSESLDPSSAKQEDQ